MYLIFAHYVITNVLSVVILLFTGIHNPWFVNWIVGRYKYKMASLSTYENAQPIKCSIVNSSFHMFTPNYTGDDIRPLMTITRPTNTYLLLLYSLFDTALALHLWSNGITHRYLLGIYYNVHMCLVGFLYKIEISSIWLLVSIFIWPIFGYFKH